MVLKLSELSLHHPLPPKPPYRPQLPPPAIHHTSTCFFPPKNPKFSTLNSSRTTSFLEETSDDLKTGLLFTSIDTKAEEFSNKNIRKVCEDPQTEPLAFEYYQKAKAQPDFRPERRTLRFLFKCLLKFKQWSYISALIDDIILYDVVPDSYTCSRLVKGCIRANQFKLAETLLRVLQHSEGTIATTVFSSAMHGYNQLHMYKCSVSVYERMVTNAISMSSSSYRWILEAYRELGNTEKVLAIFLEYRSRVSETSIETAGIYLTVCESLGRSGRALEALRYMREVEEEGFELGSSIYASLISSFAGINEAKTAEELFEEAAKKGLLKNQDTVLKMVVMYVSLRSMEKTIGVVETTVKAGIGVSDCIFSTVINGFVQRKGVQAAVIAYRQLVSFGCEPGQVTYASVINAYCRLGLSRKAEIIFNEMVEKGFDKCVVAYSNMISMYGKTGKVKEAMKLLARMKEKGCQPNVWVYNSLLDVHGKTMNLKQAEKVWKEMKRKKISPDRISYTSIISAYSRARKFEECVEFYEEFKMNGGKVDKALAGIMVGVLSKGNRFDKLVELVQHMESDGIVLDERLRESALRSLVDAGIQVPVGWLQKNFRFRKDTD